MFDCLQGETNFGLTLLLLLSCLIDELEEVADEEVIEEAEES